MREEWELLQVPVTELDEEVKKRFYWEQVRRVYGKDRFDVPIDLYMEWDEVRAKYFKNAPQPTVDLNTLMELLLMKGVRSRGKAKSD